MVHRVWPVLLLLLVSTAVAAIGDKIQKKLDTVEGAYKAAVSKADNARFYAVQKATADRVKGLKPLLAEATKAGDSDAVDMVKELLAASESSGVRSKPKMTVQFGGHSYAMLPDKVTWHIARRRCEEMGGHLATIETPEEEQFVLEVCRTNAQSAWLGATDEEAEGDWRWVTGGTLANELKPRWNLTNEGDVHHYLSFYAPGFGDADAGTRLVYLCEWDK